MRFTLVMLPELISPVVDRRVGNREAKGLNCLVDSRVVKVKTKQPSSQMMVFTKHTYTANISAYIHTYRDIHTTYVRTIIPILSFALTEILLVLWCPKVLRDDFVKLETTKPSISVLIKMLQLLV